MEALLNIIVIELIILMNIHSHWPFGQNTELKN